MENFKNQAIVFIQVKGIGFTFSVDTMSKHNLVSPCFVDFVHEENPPSQERLEFHEKLNLNFPTLEVPIQTSLYLFEDVFKKRKGIKKSNARMV